MVIFDHMRIPMSSLLNAHGGNGISTAHTHGSFTATSAHRLVTGYVHSGTTNAHGTTFGDSFKLALNPQSVHRILLLSVLNHLIYNLAFAYFKAISPH